jgi:hypothetical protein
LTSHGEHTRFLAFSPSRFLAFSLSRFLAFHSHSHTASLEKRELKLNIADISLTSELKHLSMFLGEFAKQKNVSFLSRSLVSWL